ncbi:MAG: hypothetical protein KIH69_013625, partial [Anaerolineae bacterium]|nr:hypothetical protein [Anaerolineae bacterium]
EPVVERSDTTGKPKPTTSPMISVSGERRRWCRSAQPPPNARTNPLGSFSATRNVPWGTKKYPEGVSSIRRWLSAATPLTEAHHIAYDFGVRRAASVSLRSTTA